MIQKNIQKCCRNFIIFKFECVMCTINENKNTCNLCLQAFFSIFFSQTCVYLCYLSNEIIKSGLNIIIAFKTEKIHFRTHCNMANWIQKYIYMNNIFYIYTAIRYSTELD